MNLTDNALQVLNKRYVAKDENGAPTETPEQLFRRVATAVAAADAAYGSSADVERTAKLFYDEMTSLRFLPNSPTLMNAGKRDGQLAACFVLPVEDSMEAIFETLKNAAIIHKSGGGTGFSFSRLRPAGARVRSTGGVASGPVSFMRVYNAATEAVKQGGTRRGANMGVLRVDHPDILSFIACKQQAGELSNFNISVGVTDAFMRALAKGGSFDLVDPASGKKTGTLETPRVMDLIAEMAWKNGEPGVVFLDRINADNPVPSAGVIESANPCGEQPLLPYESCNLGSINLNKFVSDGAIDFEALRATVDMAVHFLDNVIDVNAYPLPVIERMSKQTRKIGLGVMGFADMLYRLRIPYHSDEAVQTAGKVMSFIREAAERRSEALAQARGSFPLFPRSVFAKSVRARRNATLTTVAPTGTISIICGSSSGIEPVFALCYTRHVLDGHLPEVHPYFLEVARERGFYSDRLMRKIAENPGISHLREIPKDIRSVFVTAHDVPVKYHLRIQAAFQEFTDNAVSKTLNLPHEATREDVKKVFLSAYELGLKGVTIYRDKSREQQVLTTGAGGPALSPRQRPATTFGMTEKVKIGCGNLYITVNFDDRGICEVFTNLGRAGGCPSQSEATSRLVSLSLRSGIDVRAVIEQLRGIRCLSTVKKDGVSVLSCPDAIGRALEKALESWQKTQTGAADGATPAKERESGETGICPECGAAMLREGGCVVCRECGYSKCG